MPGVEELEDRVTALEHNMWGVRGDNGVVTALRALTDEVRANRAADDARREAQAKEDKSRSRATVTAAVAAVISLIGVIVTLVAVLQSTPT